MYVSMYLIKTKLITPPVSTFLFRIVKKNVQLFHQNECRPSGKRLNIYSVIMQFYAVNEV